MNPVSKNGVVAKIVDALQCFAIFDPRCDNPILQELGIAWRDAGRCGCGCSKL
jgi:hypothetical protein